MEVGLRLQADGVQEQQDVVDEAHGDPEAKPLQLVIEEELEDELAGVAVVASASLGRHAGRVHLLELRVDLLRVVPEEEKTMAMYSRVRKGTTTNEIWAAGMTFA